MATTPPAPAADASNAPLDDHDALPPGTRFGELEILSVLGIGGFGIVYLAQDHALERHVALKEYMPSSLAGRGKGQVVSVRSGAHTETYALGLRSFVNEARLLARFNHPSLVKVYRFWEENGTAYMVMPYLQGRTLREVRRAMSSPPTEYWVRSVLDPMLDALELLHREDVYHRDIAPDNILLPPGELPVLLDFGAARRAIGDRTQTFTAILKPSYAPIEQYAEVNQLRQGPWTDLYALGAVVYYLLRGAPPPPATARAVQDDEPLLTAEQNAGFSLQFLSAIEWALAIRPAERPQSIAALRDVIVGRAKAPARERPGLTSISRTIGMSSAEQAAFAPTIPADFSQDNQNPMELTQPMTGPPSWTAPRSHLYRPPIVDPVTAPMTDLPIYLRTQPDTTAMPVTPTVDTPLPFRRRYGVRAAAAVAALLGLGATAAWINGSRGPSNEVVGPVPIASAPADHAAVTPPSEAPAVAKDKIPRAGDSASEVIANELKPDHQRHPLVHDDPHLPTLNGPGQNVDGQPRPAAAAPVSPAKQGPISPREACGNRVFLALALCMEEQCERPRFKSHPQCDRVREIVERRRRGENGG